MPLLDTGVPFSVTNMKTMKMRGSTTITYLVRLNSYWKKLARDSRFREGKLQGGLHGTLRWGGEADRGGCWWDWSI